MSQAEPSPRTPRLACVTGAGGFVASWLVAELLARGVRVRGTLRDPGKAGHLRALPAAGHLELVKADLQAPAAFDAAVSGCDTVFHTASPYTLNVVDPQRDLVDPALQGTRNVLAACARAGGIRRVVLTSSMAAVTDEPESDRVLTDADWNTKSTLDRNPYYYSKVVAERAAWDFMAIDRPSFDLVVINPFMVIGPSLIPSINTSNQVLVDLMKGVYPGILALSWGMVDVRDVAHAHLRAAEVPAAAGRYLCAQPPVSMRQLVAWLREAGYGRGARLPSVGLDHAIGSLLVRLASYSQQSGSGTYLRTHLGRTPRYDASRIQRELGVQLRPTRTTVLDTMADLVKWGHIAQP